jgi:hypothetical protein
MLPSDKAKNDVDTSVRAAMATIKKDIDGCYDVKTGFHSYAPNRGRMSIAEVLRRAGGVDKNTLKEGYHKDLRTDVLAFVAAQKARLTAHHEAEARKVKAAATSASQMVDSYAQIAKAADFRADEAEREVRRLTEKLAESDGGRLAAEARAEQLQIELSEGRVVRLQPSS